MKFLLSLLVVTIALADLNQTASAQDSSSLVPSQGAADLQTQPRSVEQSQPSSPQPADARSSAELQNAAGTLQANPAKPVQNSIIPAQLLTPPAPKPVDPLDFFRVPPLDGGIKVRVGG